MIPNDAKLFNLNKKLNMALKIIMSVCQTMVLFNVI
jgi:hypothetical protein